ncbi:hypothetical protein SAMN04487831_102356 [Pseudobutyrivibrio sp. UC1225]|uniref:hypothetical protein n=1 Tax=Pseudobutyrivibrio sp. UC1225 TaxID=1798185 RepID=UPI0008E43414|nr:hypothetical protein [Pseudobutyrivibrio sp. UC1225]SFN66868.1 hypothetical protein SAMN04487831_102356 [Pseudobutyrivibrio sp. UC1225]
MNSSAIALFIVLGAIVLVPIIFKSVLKTIQDIDYKRQVEGKIPERTFHGKIPPADSASDHSFDVNVQTGYKESCDAELRMRGAQNFFGPK